MSKRKRAAGLALALLVSTGTFGATPTAKAADVSIDPYAIDWVVKYEEDFSEAVAEPEEWVRDDYSEQKDEFWGDYGYAERYYYAQSHNGADLKDALDEFGAYRKSYTLGQDGWLTIESYARNEGDDPDEAPESGGRFIINGDGKAVMVCEKHTDAAIIGSTDPLPSTYRLEVTVKNIDVGGLNQDENGKDVAMGSDWSAWTREEENPYVDYEGERVNGYFTDEYLSSGPWIDGDARSQNGMYFLGIVDYGNPRPQNNTFIHYHRKLAFDTDNNGPTPWSYVYDADGNKQVDGSRYISMLWLDAQQQQWWSSGCQFFSYTTKDGGTPEVGTTMLDKYLPGEEYTFAVIRTPESYTMEVTGNFYYGGQTTYSYTKPHVDEDAPSGLSGWTYHFNQTLEELNGLVPPNWSKEYLGETREDWAEDATYPDYFYVGIPHINFYSGTAEFTNITLKVPKGSDDDPAMNVTATVKVDGAVAEGKVYDGKTVTVDTDGVTITDLESGDDLTELLEDRLTYTWYSASDPDRALSITPKQAGDYILEVGVDTTISGELYRGVQTISIEIEKATVTITADDQTIELNGDLPTAYTYTVTGLAEGDTLALEPTVTCAGAKTTKNASYTITTKGATLPRKIAGNYNAIVYQNGTLKVGTGASSSGGGGGSSGGGSSAANTSKKDPAVTTNVRNGVTTTTITYASGVTVEVQTTAAGETTATVKLPKKISTATVTIPVEHATPGLTAVLVKEDGSEEIVRWSVLTDEGLKIQVNGSVTLKLVDMTNDFRDVGSGHWASAAVDYVSSRQLFQGYGDGRFLPTETMNRGMLLTVLARLAGQDTTPAVGEDAYARGCAWAVENGISNGENPYEAITRQELALLLWRYAGKPATTYDLSDFKDHDTVDATARVPMAWAVENGIIFGTNDGLLDPHGNATRAQVAAMLERFVKAVIE